MQQKNSQEYVQAVTAPLTWKIDQDHPYYNLAKSLSRRNCTPRLVAVVTVTLYKIGIITRAISYIEICYTLAKFIKKLSHENSSNDRPTDRNIEARAVLLSRCSNCK